jgi:hypothetical protein
MRAVLAATQRCGDNELLNADQAGPPVEHEESFKWARFRWNHPFLVIAGLVPAIHVDARDKPGHDEQERILPA